MLLDGKLEVFEAFQKDTKLPKFQKDETQQDGVFVTGDQWGVSTVRNAPVIIRQLPRGGSFYVPLSVRFWRWLTRYKEPDAPRESMSVEKFFASLKNSTEELKIVKERALGYEHAIKVAEAGGQTAYVEQLKFGLVAYRQEAQMLAMGLNKFLTEETVVNFYRQSKKGLRLDWIANFARKIPDELIEIKVRADELHIFDNYVVLHYDPQAKAFQETQAQKEAKRDPILFGLLEGKRQLYYIGDWVDEYCDLTLDDIADALGKEVVKEIPKDNCCAF